MHCLATPAACDPQPGSRILQLSTQAHSSAFCFAFGLPQEVGNTTEVIIVKLSELLVQGQPDKAHRSTTLCFIPTPRSTFRTSGSCRAMGSEQDRVSAFLPFTPSLSLGAGREPAVTSRLKEGNSTFGDPGCVGAQNYPQHLAQPWHVADT